MSSSHIQNRFAYHPPKGSHQERSAAEWNNWQWQIDSTKNLPAQEKTFVTAYYLNLREDESKCDPISLLIHAQSYLYSASDNWLDLSDEKMFSKIAEANVNANGLTEISFPFISVIPQRITTELINHLKKQNQIIIHFAINHPGECTRELFEACTKLADSGFILNNHMTLLKGINDSSEIVKELNLKLLMMRIRPYSIYLYENRVKEADFFDVPRESGVEILESLRGWTSGLAVPHLLVKNERNFFETLLPNYIKKNEGENFVFRNYKNMDYEYINS